MFFTLSCRSVDAGNELVGEAAIVLRPIQELLFDLFWILQPKERDIRLERVYMLEAEPYHRWETEVRIVDRGRYLPNWQVDGKCQLLKSRKIIHTSLL